MARPTRQGIDYFPYDVDLDKDDKLGMIIGEFGFKGEFLFIKLCAFIYKNEGYYTDWNEDAQLRFLSRYSYCGFSMSFINEVAPRFVKWGLFDKTVFDAFGVLTSVRIQETWLDASRKRKERKIDEKIWLLGVSSAPEAEETGVSGGSYPQSKVKKSKVKGKESTGAAPAGALAGSNLFRKPNIPTLQQVQEAFIQRGGTLEQAEKFFDKHQATAWYLNGSPIKAFASLVPGFISAWKDKSPEGNTGEKRMVY